MHLFAVPAASLPSISSALQSLPWGLHALVVLALIAGLVLWLVGRQVLRPTTIFLSCVTGAVGGFILWPVLARDSGVSPYVGMGVGLALGLLLGFALYRLTTAAAFGIMAAAAFALLTATGFHLASNPPRLQAAASLSSQDPVDYPEPTGSGLGGGDEQPVVLPPDMPDEPPLIDPDVPNPPPPRKRIPPPSQRPDVRATTPPAAKAPARAPAERVTTPTSPGSKAPAKDATPHTPPATPRDPLTTDRPAPPELSDTAARAHNLVAALRAEADDRWQRTPAGERLWIMVAGVVGAVVGIILGILMPAWAAAAITSFVGAAVALPAAAWLMVALDLPGQSALNLSPLGWSVLWISAALLGLVVQSQGLIPVSEPASKPKRKRAPKRAAE